MPVRINFNHLTSREELEIIYLVPQVVQTMPHQEDSHG